MAKKASDALFRLIKSLHPNEKGYFKKISKVFTSKKQKEYLKLFNAINQQEDYDEEALKKKFRKENWTKQFPVAKHYLHQQILKVLRIYGTLQSTESALNEGIEKAQIYFKKGLYDLGGQEFEKLREDIPKQQFNHKLLELNILTSQYKKQHPQLFSSKTQLLEEREALLSYMLTATKYEQIFQELLTFLRKETIVHNQEQYRYCQQLLKKTEQLKDQHIFTSNELQLQYHNIYMMYFFTTKDFINAYPHTQKILQLHQQHPLLSDSKHITYLESVINHLHVCQHLYYLDEIAIHLTCFKEEEEDTPVIRQKKTALNIIARQSYYRLTGNYTAMNQLANSFNNELQTYTTIISSTRQANILFNFAVSYFVTGQHEQALDVTSMILGTKKLQQRKDIMNYSRVLELMIHYELGNYILLESLLKTHQRYIKRHNWLKRFEEIFFKYFKKLLKAITPQEKLQIFGDLQQQLKHLTQQNYYSAWNILHLDSWLETKLEGGCFYNKVQTKQKNRLKGSQIKIHKLE